MLIGEYIRACLRHLRRRNTVHFAAIPVAQALDPPTCPRCNIRYWGEPANFCAQCGAGLNDLTPRFLDEWLSGRNPSHTRFASFSAYAHDTTRIDCSLSDHAPCPTAASSTVTQFIGFGSNHYAAFLDALAKFPSGRK